MDLINFQGLNCYHNCMISIANNMGVDYPLSFATLWSETDFRYEPEREVYLTKRMITNLELLGAKLEILSCSSPEETQSNLSVFHEHEYMMIGMDAFYIPWSSFYETFHGPHHFIARNTKKAELVCFDPTPNKRNELISSQQLIDHSFDLCRIHPVPQKNELTDSLHEAQEVLHHHPQMQQDLLQQIDHCRHSERKNTRKLATYIDAMISNRYCFRHYLQNQLPANDLNHVFLRSDFLSNWFIVKNGLYKASISNNNDSIFDEVSEHLIRLIEKEIAIAEQMI